MPGKLGRRSDHNNSSNSQGGLKQHQHWFETNTEDGQHFSTTTTSTNFPMEPKGKPPAHFFSNNFDHDNGLRMMLSKQRRPEPEQQTSSSSAIGMAPTYASATGQHLPYAEGLKPIRRGSVYNMMRQGQGSSIILSDNHDDLASFRSDTIERMIALQEAQARRDIELEQIHQLEIMQAANLRRIEMEKKIMMTEQQQQQLHHLRSRQLNPFHPTLGHGEGGIIDEIGEEEAKLMARLSQLRSARLATFQPKSTNTNELLPRRGTPTSISIRQDLLQRSTQTQHLMAPATQNFHHPQYLRHLSAEKKQGSTVPMRYWNNGVEVDTRGIPLHSSPLNRLGSINSTTSTAATITTCISSPSASNNGNIISTFSNLVVTSIPEVSASVSNLLSDIIQIRGYPSDPLIVNSKFPGFVGSVLLELKSLGERSKDKKELYDRVTKCVAAIEPNTEMSDLGVHDSAYRQIRVIVKEGTERASALILDDPSERRAIEKKKRGRKRKGRGDTHKEASNVEKKRRSGIHSDSIDILQMYKDHKSRKDNEENEKNDDAEVDTANEPRPPLTSSPVEKSGGTSLRIPAKANVDEGSSHTSEMEQIKASSLQIEPRVSCSPCSCKKGSDEDDSSKCQKECSTSDHRAKKNAIFEDGPHSNILHQIFGNVEKRDQPRAQP